MHMSYVDGFVIPVPKMNLKKYWPMAKLGKKTWMKYGALDYKECVGNDLKSKWGMPFPKLMKLKPEETVVFSFIVFKSKAHRDSVNKKVMKVMHEQCASLDMPFDAKRMVYGGFKTVVE